MSAVRIEECSGDVDDRSASPVEHKTGLFGHDRDRSSLEVFFRRIGEELIFVFRRYDHSHALLGFGDRKLCAVQTLIFLGHEIEIDIEAVGKFADRNRDAACAEIIALLDEA